MTLSKFVSVGFALLALSGSRALASDVAADRATVLQNAQVQVVSTGAKGSTPDACPRDCCANKSKSPTG